MSAGASLGAWDAWIEAGFSTDLLPVAPTGTPAATSSLTDIGKVPSIYKTDGTVVGIAGWTTKDILPHDIGRWSGDTRLGICLRTRHARAVDIDIPDPKYAKMILDTVLMHVPGAPVRSRSNSSKCLVLIKVDGEQRKRIIPTAQGRIEILGNGQQCVVDSTHPSGVRYEWNKPPADIPTLTPEQFELLIEDLIMLFATADAVIEAPTVENKIFNDPVIAHLDVIREDARNEQVEIVCPFVEGHSLGTGGSSTVYLPAFTGGHAEGHFKCLHASCAGRSQDEFLRAVGIGVEDSFDVIAPGEPARIIPSAPVDPFGEIADADGTVTPDKPVSDAYVFEIASAFAAGGEELTWLIQDVLPKDETVVIYGASGAGKSFAALDMGLAIATGTTWYGHVTEQQGVAYVAAEGAAGFRKRLRAHEKHTEKKLDQTPFYVLPAAPDLSAQADVRKLIIALKQLPRPLGVVFIDTLAQTLGAGDENSGKDIALLLKHCKTITKKTGVVVVLIHHAGKDAGRGARGHSSLRAAASCEIEVSRVEDIHTIRITKQKDGEDGALFDFKLEAVDLGLDSKDNPIHGAVVVHTSIAKDERKTALPAAIIPVWKNTRSKIGDACSLSDGMVGKRAIFDILIHEGGLTPAMSEKTLGILVSSGRLRAVGDCYELL